MNQELEVSLVHRVLEHLDARTTDTDEAVVTVGVDRYTDPGRLTREIEALFRGPPLAVAHGSRVREPGDHVVVETAGRSILVVRGQDGRLHAHLNVCRHRGTQLLPDRTHGQGCLRFSCPYHGWTYAADGRLVGIPHRHGFPGIDADSHGLRPVAVAEHAGLVWVGGGDPGTPLDVAGWLGELGDLLEGEGTPAHHVYDVRREERPLDWKLAIDIFLETYHLRTTHAGTIFPMFFDNVGLVDRVGPHLRNLFPKRSIAGLRDTDPASWRVRDHANVLLHIFPNTLVLLEPDHMTVLHVYPLGPGRSRIDSYTLVPEAPTTDKARAYWDANVAILYGATAEDFERGESIQAGFASGANEVLTFGRFEHALSHFHTGVDAALAES